MKIIFQKCFVDYPEAVADTKVFAGLMKDLFPGQQMQINLINTTYALGIAGEIADAAHINNAFAFRFVKRLVDEYGVSPAECGLGGFCLVRLLRAKAAA